MGKIKVTVWNEYIHEVQEEAIRQIYPLGIHEQIKSFLDPHDDLEVRTATLHGPNFLTDELLNDTDVLIWWAHMAHHEVSEELASKIRDRVYNDGMGFIALHSAHFSKPFRYIVGSSGKLLWSDEQKEIIWTINAAHPIAAGIPEHIDLGIEEVYGEPFMIPQPDEDADAGTCRSGHPHDRHGRIAPFYPVPRFPVRLQRRHYGHTDGRYHTDSGNGGYGGAGARIWPDGSPVFRLSAAGNARVRPIGGSVSAAVADDRYGGSADRHKPLLSCRCTQKSADE